MSRRRSFGRLTREPARWVTRHDTPTYEPQIQTEGSSALDLNAAPVVPMWFAARMPEPWDYYFWFQWPAAWADITLRVCNGVWRNQGAKLYAVHRDSLLKDDLRDWLIVRAIEAATTFVPRPWHAKPESNWASFLRSHLNMLAPQHFANVIGRSHTKSGKAAIKEHNRGVYSLEFLDEWGDETGYAVGRHALHGESFLYGKDPASITIRIEDLARNVERIEREDHHAGPWSTSSTKVGDDCLINGCVRPSIARGLCRAHYQSERRRTKDGCTKAGCTNAISARGLCSVHYKELREQALKEGTWDPKRATPACTHPGCTTPTPVHARGLCDNHYRTEMRRRKREASS